MTIKAIVIQGVRGDVEICRTGAGAHAVRAGEIVAEFGRRDGSGARREAAGRLAAAVHGVDRDGRPAATGAMIDDLARLADQVAG